MTSTDERIRAKMRQVMAEKNLTQVELAKRLGVKQPSIAAILSGKRGTIPQSLLDLLDALDLELNAQPKK